jgi:HSP20 family molecular chaperone IbpA
VYPVFRFFWLLVLEKPAFMKNLIDLKPVGYIVSLFRKRFGRKEFTSADDQEIKPVHITEDERNYEMFISKRGLKATMLDVRVSRNILTIEAREKEQTEAGDDLFTRSFTLPANANLDKIDAHHVSNGIQMTIAKENKKLWLEKDKIK